MAFVDGIELGRATVTVTTLGAEFLRDVAGSCPVEDFPWSGRRCPSYGSKTTRTLCLRRGAVRAGRSFRDSGRGVSGESGSQLVPRVAWGHLGLGVCGRDGRACDWDRRAAGGAYGRSGWIRRRYVAMQTTGLGCCSTGTWLGDGVHEVVAFVDDVEAGRATVRVTTLGRSFCAALRGNVSLRTSPTTGETVTLECSRTARTSSSLITNKRGRTSTEPVRERVYDKL